MKSPRCRRAFATAGAAALVSLAGLAATSADPFAGVSLSISKETAPPGAVAQLKVFITEPKPISTGSASFSFEPYADVIGIAVMSPAYDTFGVALVRGPQVTLSLVSRDATFGTNAEYPILTVAGHVAGTAPIGTKYPLTIDPTAIQLWGPFGVLYPVEVKSGHLVASSGVAISDVSPGSALLAAGDVVTIRGTNFTGSTNIRFREAKIARIQFVDSGRIDVVLAQALRMHGVQVKASNPDGSQAVYYSYQRTRAASPSADPVLREAVPLLPPTETTSAMLTLPAATPVTTYGVAIQNIEPFDAVAAATVLDGSGAVLATAPIGVPRRQFVVRELSELFGFTPPAGWTIRVTSAVPVQVVGIAADQVARTAWPIVTQ